MSGHYKLLVTDIDGTLLGKDRSISAEDRAAVIRARQAGVGIALSTGRAIGACYNIMRQLAIDGCHVFFDGALVSDPDNGREVYAWSISPGMVNRMVDFAHTYNIDLELYSATHYYVEKETWSAEAHREFFGILPTITDLSKVEDRIIKGALVVTNPEEDAKARMFRTRFEGELFFSTAGTPSYPGVDFINILAPEVSKGKALHVLVSHLGLSLDEVMAVGDGLNDVSLLSSAGLAVAMGNAPEEVKAVADHITLDVEHSGLAAAINKFLL